MNRSTFILGVSLLVVALTMAVTITVRNAPDETQTAKTRGIAAQKAGNHGFSRASGRTPTIDSRRIRSGGESLARRPIPRENYEVVIPGDRLMAFPAEKRMELQNRVAVVEQTEDPRKARGLVRREVTRALEEARSAKLIGHPLDAEVILRAGGDLHDRLVPYREELRSIFIVSSAVLEPEEPGAQGFGQCEMQGLAIKVQAAAGQKCQRCWIHDVSVGVDPDHPAICSRCRRALEEIA